MNQDYKPSDGEHPITPPPELVEEWWGDVPSGTSLSRLATQAAQWGADQELEACCQSLRVRGTRMRCMEASQTIKHLRAARRPKPPSLKEQALERLELAKKYVDVEPIRRAIEQLPDAH